ncbi:MAG: tetratricopeptide repeat protein, partial [Cyanobacteriota bacterium]
GEEHPHVADCLNNLANLYESQGRYDQAELLHIQALALRKRLLGEEHPAVAQSLNNLALLYESQDRYDQAEPLYRQALTLYKQQLGEEHIDVTQSLNNLAALYQSQGKYNQAEAVYLQALELRKRLLGEDHLAVAQSLNNLAFVYKSQGKYNQAESLYLQALRLYKQQLGEEHPDIAQSLNNLAALYESQGKYDQAEPLHIQALELTKRLLGEEHPAVAQSLNNLAALYKSQGKYNQAEPLHIQALELRKRILGEEHIDVAQSLNNLALVYESQGRYDEAEPLYRLASEIAERKLGIKHPWTVKIRENFNHFKEILSAIEGRPIQDYRQLARDMIRRMSTTDPTLIEAPKFEIGTVWEVLLPLVGLRLRTQKAVLFLREREESNNIHEYLSEITFDKNAAFLIVVDLVDIRRPPIEVGSPTIWFRPKSLIEMATTPENELLGWLGRFITTQIDICALPGLLPYQITGAAKELFFGRDYELTRLIGGTLRGGIIVGAHRSGKTSLLHQLGKRLEQRDCQVVGVLTLGGIESFQSFFERTLEPLDIDFPEGMTPASWASALRAYGKNNQSPVFLLDEVDDLICLDTQSEFTLGKQMRSLQSDSQCEFYLAGHAKLRQAIEVEGGPFRNFAEEITLTGLTETASMRLIQQPMKLIGFEITDDQARRIYEGTAGVAVLLQEFCIRLLRGLRQVNTSHIEDAEIEKIEQSPEYLSVVFEHYKYAQEWDCMAVLLLTTILEEVKKRDIIKELSKQGASLTASRLDKILEFLVRFGVLEEFNAGEYRVLPGYLCHAIQAREADWLLESALEQGGVSKPLRESYT